MTAEEERTRLIGAIARVLCDGPVPDEARAAALTFIGWLARRMPGEPVSHCDVARCKGLALDALGFLDGGSAPNPPLDGGSAPNPPLDGGFASKPLAQGYDGPPSGAKPCAEYADGPDLRASNASGPAR